MPYLTKQQILTLSFLLVASLMLLTKPGHAGVQHNSIDHAQQLNQISPFNLS